MPVKFRCTGCRSKLYVPVRWHGTSIECPRCATRVMVPAGGAAPPTSLEGPEIERSLDALDGTPVLDVKPVMAEFLPRGHVRQPEWSHELMRHYWDTKK